jgi:hypothetical protein
MPKISPDTTVKINLGLIVIILIWAFGVSWKAYGYVTAISTNSAAIQSVSTSLKVGRISDEIGDLKRERRNLSRDLRDDPQNELLADQIAEIDDEIEELERKLKCVTEGNKVCE